MQGPGGGRWILPWGMVAATCGVISAVLRGEAPAQTLILAALAIVLISGLWLWYTNRRG